MNLYSKAPVINRDLVRGLWAEGLQLGGDTELTFSHAANTMGYLVPPNRYMTGSQWVEAIKKSYDPSEPRIAAVIEAINRVMLVDKFSDDHVLFLVADEQTLLLLPEDGVPVFRGTSVACDDFSRQMAGRSFVRRMAKEVSVDDLRLADEATSLEVLKKLYRGGGDFISVLSAEERGDLLAKGVAFSVHELGAPAEVLYVPRDARDDLLLRSLALLKSPPVGREKFTPEQSGDYRACFSLMAALAQNQGYGAFIAYGGSLGRPLDPAASASAHFPTADFVQNAMFLFVDSLMNGDWSDNKTVFLCRPAPVDNPFGSMRPYESLVHKSLIGWRIPSGVVQFMCDQVREMSDQGDVVRELGERAI